MDTTKPFTWSTISAAQGYYMTVGTTKGAYDLVNAGPLPASQSSYNVPALPMGQTLYARTYTELNGYYNNYKDITFTAAARGGGGLRRVRRRQPARSPFRAGYRVSRPMPARGPFRDGYPARDGDPSAVGTYSWVPAPEEACLPECRSRA